MYYNWHTPIYRYTVWYHWYFPDITISTVLGIRCAFCPKKEMSNYRCPRKKVWKLYESRPSIPLLTVCESSLFQRWSGMNKAEGGSKNKERSSCPFRFWLQTQDPAQYCTTSTKNSTKSAQYKNCCNFIGLIGFPFITGYEQCSNSTLAHPVCRTTNFNFVSVFPSGECATFAHLRSVLSGWWFLQTHASSKAKEQLQYSVLYV